MFVTIPKAPLKCNFYRAQFVTLATLVVMLMILASPSRLHAQGSGAAAAESNYFLVPAASTMLRLHTHTADIDLAYDGAALFAAVDAVYRLQNTASEPVAATLKLVTDSPVTSLTLPDNLVVLVNNQPLLITQAEDGSPVVQVQTPADATLDVRLNYVIDLGEEPLVTLRYAPGLLRQWRGQPSLRVSIGGVEATPEPSWIRIDPIGWTFAPGNGQAPRLRWLYDAQLPNETFAFTFIHPATWQALREVQDAATPGAPSSTFSRLAERYADLVTASTDVAMRDRFFAQAVAAYLTGLENAAASAANTQEVAALHRGLAALYRTRAVGADGVVERAYMSMMADEAENALTGLAVDDPARTELLRWQVEGLTLRLNAARDARDWPAAFATLEQLAVLPPSVVDRNTLSETHRALAVQQALQLLEQGDSEAAMYLAGAQVSSVDLLPPANARPLFATWQVTATIAPAQAGVVFTTQPVTGRESEAHRALESLVEGWRSADRARQFTFTLQPVNENGESDSAFQLILNLPASGGAASLTRTMPAGADWALVRTVLAQLAPTIERNTQWLHEQIRLSQPLDLRSTHEQWTSIAATLEQQADQVEAQSPQLSLTATETALAEQALLARIKAANYRAAASAWRTLARNSLVAVQLSAGAGVPPVSRVWLATPETPLQTLALEADVISLGRLMMVVGGAFVALFFVAGALWSLL